jgi:ActR/RegA family two-component response regulator
VSAIFTRCKAFAGDQKLVCNALRNGVINVEERENNDPGGASELPQKNMSEKETKQDLLPPLEQGEDKTVKIRVLLVDDEEGYVNVLSNRLKKRGFDVTRSYSGTEALQALRKKEFDVAVLDLKMEDMDGLEVLKVFKRMDPQMEVIMLTGHGSQTAAVQGIEMGAYDYLTKPCEFESLLKKIQKASQKQKRESE